MVALAVATLAPVSRAEGQGLAATFIDPPTAVAVPAGGELVYRLGLRAGDQPVRVRITTRAARAFGAEHGREEGYPISLAARMHSDGDAVEESATIGFGTIACGTSGGAPHGLEGSGQTMDLWIPARGATTVTARFNVAPTPPWPTTDYRPAFKLDPYRARSAADQAARPDGEQLVAQTLMPPLLRVEGKRGIRIALETRPATAPASAMRGFEIPAGQPFAISGEVDPAPAVGRLLLRYAGPETGRELRDIAAVVLDDAGRFSYDGWRPTAEGYHDLWAFATSASSDNVDDHFCPRSFTVRGSGAPVPPAPELRLMRSTGELRGGRKPRATLMLGCSAPPQAPCRGDVVLRRRERGRTAVLGRRRFVIQPGVRAAVAVPLRRRRRLPIRLTVTADAAVAGGEAMPRTRVRLARAPR